VWLPLLVLGAISAAQRSIALVLGAFCSRFGLVEIVPNLDTPRSASPLVAAHRGRHEHHDKHDRDRHHDYDDAGPDGEHHDSAEHVGSFLD
jgi:hypothetical protein